VWVLIGWTRGEILTSSVNNSTQSSPTGDITLLSNSISLVMFGDVYSVLDGILTVIICYRIWLQWTVFHIRTDSLVIWSAWRWVSSLKLKTTHNIAFKPNLFNLVFRIILKCDWVVYMFHMLSWRFINCALLSMCVPFSYLAFKNKIIIQMSK